MQTLENAKIFIANHDNFFLFYHTHNVHDARYTYLYTDETIFLYSRVEPSTLLFIDASHQQINGHKQQLNQNLSDKTIEHAMLNEFQLKTS